MALRSDQDFITYYGLEDIPKRFWVAPKTYEEMITHHEHKEVTKAVINTVKDRLWFIAFKSGVVTGLIVIGLLIWKSTLP